MCVCVCLYWYSKSDRRINFCTKLIIENHTESKESAVIFKLFSCCGFRDRCNKCRKVLRVCWCTYYYSLPVWMFRAQKRVWKFNITPRVLDTTKLFRFFVSLLYNIYNVGFYWWFLEILRFFQDLRFTIESILSLKGRKVEIRFETGHQMFHHLKINKFCKNN